MRRRRLVGLAALLVLLALCVVASVCIGAKTTTPEQVWHALTGPTGTSADDLVRALRVPRTVLGLLVGLALGVAGALIQGHTRNPLADTGLLGLNAGAALFVVIGINVFGLTGPGQYVWLALVGALVAGVVVFGAASVGAGAADPLNLALAGVAVTFVLQAATNTLVLLDSATMDNYRFWIVGSLAGRDLAVFWQVLPFLLAGLLLAAINVPALNLLNLGEDVARSLGSNVALGRATGLAAVTLLAGGATAACGPIAFVGLIVPHLARLLTGPDYRWLVPFAGLFGAIVLLAADTVGRIVVIPAELPVGIMLAVIGAPFFVAVVRRRRMVAL